MPPHPGKLPRDCHCQEEKLMYQQRYGREEPVCEFVCGEKKREGGKEEEEMEEGKGEGGIEGRKERGELKGQERGRN